MDKQHWRKGGAEETNLKPVRLFLKRNQDKWDRLVELAHKVICRRRRPVANPQRLSPETSADDDSTERLNGLFYFGVKFRHISVLARGKGKRIQ